jgi:hypothetical protein
MNSRHRFLVDSDRHKLHLKMETQIMFINGYLLYYKYRAIEKNAVSYNYYHGSIANTTYLHNL